MKKEYELGSQKNQPRQHGPGQQMGGEKAKNFKTTIKKIIMYTKKRKNYLYIAILFAMLGSMLTLVGPNQITKITDEITSGIANTTIINNLEENGFDTNNLQYMTLDDLAELLQTTTETLMEKDITIENLKNPEINLSYIKEITIFLVIVYLTGYILSVTQGLIISTIMQTTSKRLRTDISHKINSLPMSYFAKASKGDVLSRVTNDVDTVGQTLTQSTGTFISSVTLLIGSVVMMSLTNISLTITAVLSTVFGFLFMMIVMKLSQKNFIAQQKHLGEINGHIEEMYAGHTVLKAYNGETLATQMFDEINLNLKTSAFKAQAMSGLMMPMMTFIGNFGYVCVCIVGAALALNGNISFGVIVAFMIYIRLFTQPLGQIAQSVQNLQSGAAAAERVFEFLEEKDMPNEESKTKKLQNIKGEVEFKNVKFGYNEENTIIHNFSTKVKPGQKIAIVGPTGAGKTTIVNLLMRFYDINKGDIFIDKTSINSVKREEVHNQFCMVLQDTWLFEGTLKENLIYSTPNINDEKLNEACEAVGLHHFIKTLPNGYDTILSDTLNLSLGQKQQITIARAMIADKPMLILDEATSSIDTRTEILIQKAMDQLMQGRTSFVIAHRLSTIKNADLILVMKDGNIIETGNHDELLKENGFYAELYNSQFEEN